jgi:hypothetical protein
LEKKANCVSQLNDYKRGQRAEEVANWYFRLNGFLSIPGFILHPDRVQRYPYTEADLIGVRFPQSAEILGGKRMDDDQVLLDIDDGREDRIVFILVEVKAGLCNINGPWSDESRGNMQRVIRRLGFVPEAKIEAIAKQMYDILRWESKSESEKFILQYIAVGSRRNDDLQKQFEKLIQVTYDDMADFFLNRFAEFPQKLPPGQAPIHKQWPDFGRYYGEK